MPIDNVSFHFHKNTCIQDFFPSISIQRITLDFNNDEPLLLKTQSNSAL